MNWTTETPFRVVRFFKTGDRLTRARSEVALFASKQEGLEAFAVPPARFESLRILDMLNSDGRTITPLKKMRM